MNITDKKETNTAEKAPNTPTKSGLTLRVRWGAETFHPVALEDGFSSAKGFNPAKAFTPRAYPASGGHVELYDGAKVIAKKPIMPEGVYEKGKPVSLKTDSLEKVTEELRAEYAPAPVEDVKTK